MFGRLVCALIAGGILMLAGTAHAAESDRGASGDRVEQIRRTIMDVNDNHVLIVAHRGHHHCLPENSIASIQEAGQIGAHIVEVDLRKSKDDIYVLMHDSTMKRTARDKRKVADVNAADITKLPLWHSIRPTTEHVPTFVEALEGARGRVILNIDMKNFDRGDIREVAEVARKAGLLDHCLFKAKMEVLDADVIAWLKEHPEVMFMPMVRSMEEVDQALAVKRWPMMEVHLNEADLKVEDKAAIEALKKRGVRVWVNSLGNGPNGANLGDTDAVSDPAVFKKLAESGVGAIQTDLPDIAAEVLTPLGK